MKNFRILLLILAIALCLCACRKGTDPSAADFVFPEDAQIMGIPVAGLSRDAAWDTVKAAAGDYTLQLSVDGVPACVSADQIDLACSEDVFLTAADSAARGETPALTGLITFRQDKLEALLQSMYNRTVSDAAVIYDEAAGAFALQPHTDGQSADSGLLLPQVQEAICSLQPQLVLTGVSQVIPADIQTPEGAQEAVDLANRMLSTRLTYHFQTQEDAAHTVTEEDIRSFIRFDETLTLTVDQDVLGEYVTALSDAYSTEGTTGSFVATGGYNVGLRVSYNGTYVDSNALSADIVACLMEGSSGTREAPYLESGDPTMAYGGTYIEVNLTSQQLWMYKNGELLVNSPLVSGNVNEDMCTPTGVFSLYAKTPDTYLSGDDYDSFVEFWMPFHGGYGLHDASWRSSFGGEIYLYKGSHGCVNLPRKAASILFENAEVGTKVILYGGKRSVPPLEQTLLGTTAYSVADDAGSFLLDIKPKHEGGKLLYSTDNAAVATVAEDGQVTVHGAGTANITVTAEAFPGYTEASVTVTVQVRSACDEGRHQQLESVITRQPTCQDGEQTTTCSKCGKVTTTVLPAVSSHSFGQWVTVQQPTCGSEGRQERTCTVCGLETQIQLMPPEGEHTPGQWTQSKNPTCTENGARILTCTVCGTVLQTEILPAEPDAHQGHWETVTPATCTQDGKQVQTCLHCGQTLAEEILPMTGHSYSGGPTCDHCPEPNPGYTVPPPEESAEP